MGDDPIVQELYNSASRMDWPSCFLDLTPIEQLWDQLGSAVQRSLNHPAIRMETIKDELDVLGMYRLHI